MLRHIVLVTIKPEATPKQRADWRADLIAMCEESPEVLSYTFGTNVGSGPNHHDTALVADFKDYKSFKQYVDGARHKDYVMNHARHVVEKLAAIQHEL
ncbi:Dabb family protein [Antarctobacter jejuensis]|uniref:Dabb family protein n=1 Tax=Antarctobacter jejuensis TaxID=1439938 RepID=UPI003FCFC2B3